MSSEQPIQRDLFGEGQKADETVKRAPLSPPKPYGEREKERREARERAGLCKTCGKGVPLPGRKNCDECRIKMNANLRCSRAGPKYQEYLAGLRERQQTWRDAERCPECGGERLPGHSYCGKCTERHKVQVRKQRKKKRAAGLCSCGKPADGKARCPDCQGKRKQREASVWKRRQEAGLCRYCGKCPPRDDRAGCDKCLQRIADRTYFERRKRLEAGICTMCGVNPLAPNGPVCTSCYVKQVSSWVFKTTKRTADLQALFDKQGGRCAYSGLPLTLGTNAALDHIIPVCAGGPTEIWNLQWVHTMVNQMKFSYSEEEFLRMIEHIFKHRLASSP